MRKAILSFVVGSSLPVTLWPLLLLGLADARNQTAQLDFSTVGLFFPVALGLANVATTRFAKRSFSGMLFAGAIVGVLMSNIGTFGFDVPGRVFQLQGNGRYLALAAGPLFYGLIWALPLRYLNQLLAAERPAIDSPTS